MKAKAAFGGILLGVSVSLLVASNFAAPESNIQAHTAAAFGLVAWLSGVIAMAFLIHDGEPQ